MRQFKTKSKEVLNILLYKQIPTPMGMKFFSLIFTGIIVLIAGTILLLVTGIAKTEITALLFPIIVGVGLILYGCVFKLSLIKTGWIVLEGTCIDHLYNYNFIPRLAVNAGRLLRGHSRGPDAFLINTAQELLYVPVAKKNCLPQIGNMVRLYISENAQKFTGTHGFIHVDPIFGYELIPDQQSESTATNI